MLTVNAQYLPNVKAYELPTWCTDGERKPALATSAVTSEVKVARSRDASDRCWPIRRERNVPKTPKLLGRLPIHTGNNAHQFQGQKVKVTRPTNYETGSVISSELEGLRSSILSWYSDGKPVSPTSAMTSKVKIRSQGHVARLTLVGP